ncbi:sulfatase-like hydrolase/transferase, partial [bacterium]|nr:sulfatase-like hydrolase/transferase [bacterium]
INAEHRSKGRKPMDGPAVDCLDDALKLPDGVDRGTFLDTLCPPLPENYAIPALEPGAVSKIVDMREFRKYIRAHWSDEDWRMHRWAYARLTERVDAEIAVVLDALRETRLDEDTVVIFTSDHGDLDAAHKLEHKSILYEEAMRVPFIISWKGKTKSGVADAANLVSSGLDLIPTMCDYAGIEPPASLHGCSARPMAEGRSPSTLREYVPVETQFGRSIVTKRYKYNLYDSGAHREQLTDLEADPGEMNNLAEDEKHRDVLKAHRALLRDWIGRNSDATAEKYLV